MNANGNGRRGHAQEEIAAAKRAMEAGDIGTARFHLQNAGMLVPEDHHDVERMKEHIAVAEGAWRAEARNARRTGFGLALAGYLLLAIQQPPDWGIPVWTGLAFVLVPLVAGLIAGLRLDPRQTRGAHFRTAALGVGLAMACYAGCTLILLRRRFEAGQGGAQVVCVWLLCTIVYGVLAGTVAGAAGVALSGARTGGAHGNAR